MEIQRIAQAHVSLDKASYLQTIKPLYNRKNNYKLGPLLKAKQNQKSYQYLKSRIYA